MISTAVDGLLRSDYLAETKLLDDLICGDGVLQKGFWGFVSPAFARFLKHEGLQNGKTKGTPILRR